MQFFAELQQREERAFWSPKRDSADTALESKTNGVFVAVNNTDKYADDVVDNPFKSEPAIKYALKVMKARETGEDLHEADFGHWNRSWI